MSSPASRAATPVPFEQAARVTLGDTVARANVLRATTSIRARRAAVVGEVPDWAELRRAGEAIRQRALLRLDELLVQLEASVVRARRTTCIGPATGPRRMRSWPASCARRERERS